LSSGGGISSTAVLQYMVPSQAVCCAHLMGVQILLVENGSATGQRRQAVDWGFVSICVWQSWSSQMPIKCSALCYCWWGCRHTKAERNLHRHLAVGDSGSTHTLVCPCTSRCLRVSAVLCFMF
jgi:hypothetical protein